MVGNSSSKIWIISFLLVLIGFQIASINTHPRFSEAQQCPPGKYYEPIDGVCITPVKPKPPVGQPLDGAVLKPGDEEQPVQPGDDSPQQPEQEQEQEQNAESGFSKGTVCLTEAATGDDNSTGSLTIRIIAAAKLLSEINTFRIWPNPYTSSQNLVVSDDDGEFDCDGRMNILSLDHVPFADYQIQAINYLTGRPLLNFNFSINQDVTNPVINIVKRDLGVPLPIRLVPDQHLLILTRTVTDVGQVANDISSRFNANIITFMMEK